MDVPEQPHHELSRLREPFGEERVGIDLQQLGRGESPAQEEGKVNRIEVNRKGVGSRRVCVSKRKWAAPCPSNAGWLLVTHLPSLTLSFWARALQRDVFPVPGGPCRSTTRFQETTSASTPYHGTSNRVERRKQNRTEQNRTEQNKSEKREARSGSARSSSQDEGGCKPTNTETYRRWE